MPLREISLLSLLFGIVPLVAWEVATDGKSVGPSGGTQDNLPQFGPGSYPSEDPDFISTISLSATAYAGFITYSGDTPRRHATLRTAHQL